jgi:hypothetical protein
MLTSMVRERLQMNITLTNVEINPRRSEETTCYSAVVRLDGKKVCHASNDGKGGSDLFIPFDGMRDTLEDLEKWASEQTPRFFEIEGHVFEIPCDLSIVINEMLEEKYGRR